MPSEVLRRPPSGGIDCSTGSLLLETRITSDVPSRGASALLNRTDFFCFAAAAAQAAAATAEAQIKAVLDAAMQVNEAWDEQV